MNKPIIHAILFIGLASTHSITLADVTDYNNSPYNYENSEMNYENSPMNYNNSPLNYQNSPLNYNSDRIVRDNSGHAMGYAVPKPDGGVNYFDMQGHREGYQGPGSRW